MPISCWRKKICVNTVRSNPYLVTLQINYPESHADRGNRDRLDVYDPARVMVQEFRIFP
jgi:hypothetical protein